MGIQLGSKIHLFYNCPPDMFMDPRIRWAGVAGGGEVAHSILGSPPPPPRKPLQENEGNHPFQTISQKQAPELMSATCTTQALAVFKHSQENRAGLAGIRRLHP